MSIKEQLTNDMKEAMKAREAGKLRLSVIRMVRSNIKNTEINEKRELSDDDVLAVLMKEVKMRQDSLEEFKKADRQELVAQAEEEIEILKKYLPAALSDDELKAIVAEVVAEYGKPCTLKMLGHDNDFSTIGLQEDLLTIAGIDSNSIEKAAAKLLGISLKTVDNWNDEY